MAVYNSPSVPSSGKVCCFNSTHGSKKWFRNPHNRNQTACRNCYNKAKLEIQKASGMVCKNGRNHNITRLHTDPSDYTKMLCRQCYELVLCEKQKEKGLVCSIDPSHPIQNRWYKNPDKEGSYICKKCYVSGNKNPGKIKFSERNSENNAGNAEPNPKRARIEGTTSQEPTYSYQKTTLPAPQASILREIKGPDERECNIGEVNGFYNLSISPDTDLLENSSNSEDIFFDVQEEYNFVFPDFSLTRTSEETMVESQSVDGINSPLVPPTTSSKDTISFDERSAFNDIDLDDYFVPSVSFNQTRTVNNSNLETTYLNE